MSPPTHPPAVLLTCTCAVDLTIAGSSLRWPCGFAACFESAPRGPLPHPTPQPPRHRHPSAPRTRRRARDEVRRLGRATAVTSPATAAARGSVLRPAFVPQDVDAGAGGVATPCCSWDNCGTCSSTSAYCESGQSECEKDCGGKWCPTGPTGPSGYDLPNICDPKAKDAPSVAYACMDWNVGSKAMTDAATTAGVGSTHFFGVGSFGGDGSNMGKCYEVSLDGVDKKGLLQVVNQGGDVSTGQFDLQTGDGGFGLYNGCAAPTTSGRGGMFPGDTSAFGKQYGGWDSKADCSKLPSMPAALATLPPGEPSLPRLCELGFELGVRLEGGKNVAIASATRVPCPAALVGLTGLLRTDDSEPETHGAGTLSRMMDCCKPSAGWVGNVPKADPKHPAVIPCTADGYTRVTVSPGPAPPSPAPSAKPTPSAKPAPAAPPVPAPVPSTKPAPAGGGCPGGSLAKCMDLCPTAPPAAFKACAAVCADECP